VYTHPGRGTAFHIDLPRCGQQAEGRGTDAPVPAPELERTGSTVLLVEDEEGVRSLARRILQSGGYTVLEASSGASAFELATRHTGKIDLLLTDVVMPDESGPELAQRIGVLRPGIRTLYVSGYTEKWLSAQGSLGPEAALLQKPFTADALLRRVQETLHSGAEGLGP
jgi:CheY-like chemotaxis protein